MTPDRSAELGFAAAHDAPIAYLARVRKYYQALGYGAPYEWAHYAEVPFRPLAKPLSRVPGRDRHDGGAVPARPGRPGPRRALQRRREVLRRLFGRREPRRSRPAHLARRDRPPAHDGRGRAHLVPARGAAPRRGGRADRRGRAALSRRADEPQPSHDARRSTAPRSSRAAAPTASTPRSSSPTARSATRRSSLVARLLEESGIASVVMGCAKDIVEHVGVPRFVFSDFPLGNAAGRPHDVASQDATLALALALLEAAPAARTTVQSPLRWSDSAEWKLDYCNIARSTPRRDRAPSRRVRCRQGAGEGAARRVGVMRRPAPAARARSSRCSRRSWHVTRCAGDARRSARVVRVPARAGRAEFAGGCGRRDVGRRAPASAPTTAVSSPRS